MSWARNLIITGGLGAIVAAAYRVWSLAHSGASSSSPTGKQMPFPLLPDSELSTLPAIPSLVTRIQKEPDFGRHLLSMLSALGAPTAPAGDKLVSLMSEESAFNPAARNPQSNTVGFLQWMPKYFSNFFDAPIPTVDEVQQMSGIDQLALVYQTVKKLPSYLTDPAMTGWGSHVNAPDGTIIASAGDVAYAQNKGYDAAQKGYITAGDVRAAVLRPATAAAKKPRLLPDGTPEGAVNA